MTTTQTILDILTQAITPAGIAAYALYLLREEGRRNARNMRKILSQYHEDTRRIAEAVQTLNKQE